MKKIKEKPVEKVWDSFLQEENISQEQLELFKKYENFLTQTNKNFNLTAILNLAGIVRQHFQDSLALRKLIDLNKINSIADVGTGAGFPSIPLKILFPHLKVILLEVNKKKGQFLRDLIKILDLKDITVCDLDWRTFIRTTQEDIDLFLTRAALSEEELTRMFRSNCHYNTSTLVYWVTDQWEVDPKYKEYLKELKEYKLAKKVRKLAFFKK